MGFLTWLESTAYAQWILTGLIGWPLVLTAHAIGLAIAVGTVYAMNMRLLGLYRTIPVRAVRTLLNLAWVGIVINIISGFSLFMTQATFYVTGSPAFLVKISAIIVGIVVLVFQQKQIDRELPNWEANGVSSQGRNLAIASLALWTLAVMTGRLIAYL